MSIDVQLSDSDYEGRFSSIFNELDRRDGSGAILNYNRIVAALANAAADAKSRIDQQYQKLTDELELQKCVKTLIHRFYVRTVAFRINVTITPC